MLNAITHAAAKDHRVSTICLGMVPPGTIAFALLPDELRSHTGQHSEGEASPNQVHQDDHVDITAFRCPLWTRVCFRGTSPGCEMVSSRGWEEGSERSSPRAFGSQLGLGF